MAVQSKGFCKYCAKEFTRSGMIRHLDACKERKIKLSEEKKKRRDDQYQLVISGKELKNYWLIVETSGSNTLKELDRFIRQIWVECCGHLSLFSIHGVLYESNPNMDSFWGRPSKNMNYRLRDVVSVGDEFTYEYDFGTTTELNIKVSSVREGEKTYSDIVILSRNNPPKIMCSQCGENEASFVDPEGYYEGNPFWCENCVDEISDSSEVSEFEEIGECEEVDDLEDDEFEEDWESYSPEYFLPICNSPRMGVCGYDGSSFYPDQFVPDGKE